MQMPLEEACHVAVQRLPPRKQRLWRHMERRQQGAAGEATAWNTAGGKPWWLAGPRDTACLGLCLEWR